jgi:hypothetical protein
MHGERAKACKIISQKDRGVSGRDYVFKTPGFSGQSVKKLSIKLENEAV